MKTKTALIFMPIMAVLAIIIGVAFGSVNVSFSDVVNVILYKVFNTKLSIDINDSTVAIIWELRLPRVFLAFCVGAALSCSGAVTQSVLRNPLASPYTLGVSSGASLGAGIVILTGFTIPFLKSFTLPVAGLTFGIATVFISVIFANKVDKTLDSMTIVLCGMVLSLFINSIIMLISGFFPDKMKSMIYWQMGTFSAKGWTYVKIIFPVLIIGIFVFTLLSRELDILTFGDEQASSMGVETSKTKWKLLIMSAILTGCSVAFSGVIGFIDLIAPHIIRKLFTSKHEYVIILSALCGGIFMVIADLIARTVVSPVELPVGCITALIGAPFFAFVFFKRRKV